MRSLLPAQICVVVLFPRPDRRGAGTEHGVVGAGVAELGRDIVEVSLGPDDDETYLGPDGCAQDAAQEPFLIWADGGRAGRDLAEAGTGVAELRCHVPAVGVGADSPPALRGVVAEVELLPRPDSGGAGTEHAVVGAGVAELGRHVVGVRVGVQALLVIAGERVGGGGGPEAGLCYCWRAGRAGVTAAWPAGRDSGRALAEAGTAPASNAASAPAIAVTVSKRADFIGPPWTQCRPRRREPR